MSNKLKVLLLENDPTDAVIVALELRNIATVDVALSGKMFKEMLVEKWDVVVADLALPDIKGTEAIQFAREKYPDIPVIIATGSVSAKEADAACNYGASRFLLKGVDGVPGLARAVIEAHEKHLLVQENQMLNQKTIRQSRNEIQGTLAAAAAHDINNFLGAIIMGIGMVRHNPTGCEKVLDSMEAAAKKGASMVQQMMAFGKGASGTSFKVTTAEDILAEIERMIRYPAKESNVRLSIRTEVGTASVKCDVIQINTVLINMCTNAVQAMPGGGDLSLEARNVLLNDPPLEGSYVCFTVKDTGHGIPEDVLPRIFDPYFSTKGDKGTGLGLALVKSILESHNGGVDVKTDATGTTFYVYLPVHRQEAEKRKEEFDGEGAVVVLVDDEEFFRSTVEVLLESANYKVLSACNGPEALSHFRSTEKISLLLSDLAMPLMCGRDLSRHLREQGFNVPTVFITGREFEEKIEPEPAAMLHKPFSREDLLSTLKRVLPK